MTFRDTSAMATVRKLLEHKRVREYVEQFIQRPDRRTYGHVIADVMEVVSEKPEIADCRRDSIVRAVGRAESWDLRMGKTAYLFPREAPSGRGKPHLMAMQSYVGKTELMIRFRMVDFVRALPVYANEKWAHHEGTDPYIEHLPIEDDAVDRGPLKRAYAWTRDRRSRTPLIAVMTIGEVDAIRQEFSEQWRGVDIETIPWYPVARAVHRLAKLIPTTPQNARVLDDDADDGGWRSTDLGRAA